MWSPPSTSRLHHASVHNGSGRSRVTLLPRHSVRSRRGTAGTGWVSAVGAVTHLHLDRQWILAVEAGQTGIGFVTPHGLQQPAHAQVAQRIGADVLADLGYREPCGDQL